MINLQIILAAASIAAAMGGSYGAERLMDRYARIPDREIVQTSGAVTEEDEAEAGDISNRS